MLNYPELRNLSIEDLYGKNNFSILDYKATITDFAILNGDLYADFNKKEIANAERFGYYWTDIQKEENAICISTPLGFDTGSFVKTRFIGIRPVISKNYLEQITEYNQNVENNTIILECGEYPKQAVSKELQMELEENYKNDNLNLAEHSYTINSKKYSKYAREVLEESLKCYEYNGEKYVRVRANSCYESKKITLSNKGTYKNGDYVWVKVEPIIWIIDQVNDIAISKDIITAGIPYNNIETYDDLERVTVNRFMNRYLVKELFQNTKTKVIEDSKERLFKIKTRSIRR